MWARSPLLSAQMCQFTSVQEVQKYFTSINLETSISLWKHSLSYIVTYDPDVAHFLFAPEHFWNVIT